MADRPTIERIAKILARANSDNEGEAEAALRGAFSRMNRDSVTFTDLLSLPERDLYQDSLVRLAEYIVKGQAELSPSQKRALYAEYLKRVVEKFSGASPGRGGESSTNSEHFEQTRTREREEAARAYEERRRQEEARRRSAEAPPKQEKSEPPPSPPPPPGRAREKAYSRQNVNTSKDGIDFPLRFDPNRFPFPSSTTDFFFFFFGAGSFIGCIYSFPKLALKLLFTSILVGGLTAAAIYAGLFLLYDWSKIELLASLWRFFFQGTAFGFVLCILIAAIVYYERGWYPRGPRQGETDIVSIASSAWRLSLALSWRVYGVISWIGNQSYVIYIKRKRAQIDKKKAL